MNFRWLFLVVFLIFYCPNLFAEVRIIRDIQFLGLSHISTADINAKVHLRSTVDQPVISSDLMIDANAIYLMGCFEKVEPEMVPVANGVRLVFHVRENSIVQKIVFHSATVFSDEVLLGMIQTKAGGVLNLLTLQIDKDRLEAFYHTKGYDLFKITQIEFDQMTDTVHFYFNEAIIEDVQFLGLSQVPSFILTRLMSQQKGNAFNSIALRSDRVRLFDLGYFSDISAPKLDSGAQPNQVKIDFQVKEKKANLINVGLENELDKDTILGFAQMDVHHVFFPSSFLSTKVQVYTLERTLSIKSYSIRYTQPWFLNWVPVATSIGNWNEYSLNDQNRLGMDLRFAIPVIQDRFQFSTTFKQEKIIPLSSLYYRMLSVILGLNYSSVDNAYNPTTGEYWAFQYEFGGNFGLIDSRILHFNRYIFNWARFFSVNSQDTIGLHFYGGLFLRRDNISISSSDLPGFIMGGGNSLRGYRDDTNEHARKLLFNVEYRHSFSDDLQGAVFVDVGRLFDIGFVQSLSDFQIGYGCGLRFLTPIGPIRTDVGVGQGSVIIHINLGQLF